MNNTSFEEFTAELAAHAGSVDAGTAPVDRVLVGARRRSSRRRAALAVGGTVVLGAAGLGIAFSGSHGSGTRQLPPAQHSSNPSGPLSGRHIPVFVQRAGRGDVAADGTEDGVSWQVVITDKAGSDGGHTLTMVLRKGGAVALTTTTGTVPGASTGSMALAEGSAWVFLVPSNVTDVAWTGSDGFRYDQATLPPRPYGSLGELRLAVFPSTEMNVRAGDEFVGYDAAGGRTGFLGEFSPPRS